MPRQLLLQEFRGLRLILLGDHRDRGFLGLNSVCIRQQILRLFIWLRYLILGVSIRVLIHKLVPPSLQSLSDMDQWRIYTRSLALCTRTLLGAWLVLDILQELLIVLSVRRGILHRPRGLLLLST